MGQAESPRARLSPLNILGPGLAAGASDDDRSGISTCSQIGGQFGYNFGWPPPLSFSLMVAIHEISARIGRVTGYGIAVNIRSHYSIWPLQALVGCWFM